LKNLRKSTSNEDLSEPEVKEIRSTALAVYKEIRNSIHMT
jgi:hypothetical protein